MTRTHTEQINAKHPMFFLFLVDQSGSMSQPFEGQPNKTMAQGVADAINGIIRGLVLRCSNGNDIKDYYYMGLIGYNHQINLGFGGELQGRYHVPVSEIAKNPLRVEERVKKVDDGVGGILETKVQIPIWLDPVSKSKTKMREAIELASDSVADYVDQFPESYPPIVINITDGLPTDATKPDFPEVVAAAKSLQSVVNQNGSNALLFNIHISPKAGQPIIYPSDDSMLPDRYSKLLFRLSSPLTDEMVHIANVMEADIEVTQGARGFVFQGDLISMIQLLDIGTRTGKN